ncbi:MAG: hypothetical protein M3396_02145 [Actinomycetota bacterium]|nr:hypothetical protein [Actinomycetota bacterium]MDQ3575114.1 hypothetical protein [Actinomycetota bacterium]
MTDPEGPNMPDPEPPRPEASEPETQSDGGGNGASPAPPTNGPSGRHSGSHSGAALGPVRLPGRKGVPRRRHSPPPSGRWWLFAAGGLFLALFAIVVSRGGDGPTLPPRTVEDQEFTRQANAACARRLPELRRDREQRRTGDEGREEALAGTVERAADELERLAVEVRGLPVAAADQGEVARWLDDWDAYIATGRRFADALRRGDNKSYADISAQSTALSERIYGFSKANGIPNCVF